MIQTDLPSNQIGKVYSLLMILQSAGASIGLLLAVLLFTLVSVPIGIALCASVMLAIGIAGLARYGFSDPVIELTHKEQGKVPLEVANTTDNVSVL